MPRLFTGLEIPAAIAQRIAMLRGGLPGARWIEPSDYHVTLRFIGDIDDRMAEEIHHQLVAIRKKPLKIRLSGVDVLRPEKPQSLHVQVEASPALSELQADHERLMRRLGLPAEPRRFTPHVTIARLKEAKPRDVGQYLAMRPAFWTDPFEITRFVLFSSRASVGGGPYLVEEAYPLAA